LELLKDLLILALLIILLRKGIQLGHVLFAAALLFGLLHGLNPGELIILIYQSLSSPANLIIYAALILISLLEIVMRRTGSQGRLVSGMKNLSPDHRFAMAALPAIIGLLPSPGGARFSAPLVEEAARELEVCGEDQAAINYWYRHIWEYFLPLYPSILLAIQIMAIPAQTFVLVMVPFTIYNVIIGLLLFRPIAKPGRTASQPTAIWRFVLEGLAPILAIMALVLIFNLNILLALFAVIIVMLIAYRVPLPELPQMAWEAVAPKLLYMMFAAIYLRDAMVATGAIDQLSLYIKSAGLDPLLVAIILPFAITFLTGMTIPGISITLPLLAAMGGPANILSLGSLTLAANMVGSMLSPIHLCLIMSVDHFKCSLGGTYRRILIPSGLLLAFAIVYALILKP